MFLNRRNKNLSLSFLADPSLFLLGAIYWIVLFFSSIIVLFLIIEDLGTDIVILFSVMPLLVNIVCLISLPKWFVIVEISENSITYKPAFKKKIKWQYSDFGYFYCAHYTYFSKRNYIVFSKRRLSDYELSHINNVSVSDKLIKIKVRKGLKEDLSRFLPPKFLLRVPKDFW